MSNINNNFGSCCISYFGLYKNIHCSHWSHKNAHSCLFNEDSWAFSSNKFFNLDIRLIQFFPSWCAFGSVTDVALCKCQYQSEYWARSKRNDDLTVCWLALWFLLLYLIKPHLLDLRCLLQLYYVNQESLRTRRIGWCVCLQSCPVISERINDGGLWFWLRHGRSRPGREVDHDVRGSVPAVFQRAARLRGGNAGENKEGLHGNMNNVMFSCITWQSWQRGENVNC